ncbi:cation-translocating P-type ATPase [Nisaea sediminum]|uniref:cation-translocating P-type ATPase n=1 Tax=Nisaea sediminum TaxID=2775867 RepID=UPI0029BFBD82|nr:cation-transporting P-type ATPase [Nisaea sediminum]
MQLAECGDGSGGSSVKPVEAVTDVHALPVKETLARLVVASQEGLSGDEAGRRRRLYGPNLLGQRRSKSALVILRDQFASLIVVLLGVAAAISFAFGHWVEGLAILIVILLNTALGFFTELRAVRSMEALRRLGIVHAKVRRDGRIAEVSARDLVPGDIVLLEGGDIVGADLRLIKASKLQCDESVLTGESLPVLKQTGPLTPDTTLPDRSNMVFQGTAVTRGAGEGVVVATGMSSELGRIAALAGEAEDSATPLEKRIDGLSRQLVWATLLLTVIIGLAGILTGKPPLLMIETAIALAVSAVPEGLPMVATLALARGMWRMARRNALIERLSAVETLGATTVILTDKTGTLTENRMTVTVLALPSGDLAVGETAPDPSKDAMLRRILEVGVLCNNAALEPAGDGREAAKAIGDPMEAALLHLGAKAGIGRQALLEAYPEVEEEAFDPELKMMATIHSVDGGFLVAVKGAPEAVLDRVTRIAAPDGETAFSDADRSAWNERSAALAEKGLRVLAIAAKTAGSADEPVYRGLTLLGLVGLQDPPRQDVSGAIAACRRAGIRVIMATGDHAVTARQIGAAVGLEVEDEGLIVDGRDLPPLEAMSEAERRGFLDAAIFARVSPKQKLDLIALHQSAGDVVAMTGDGVNDAPALTKADIGVAMGQRGSQVAREAADMVLRDDAFTSIVAAIAQGRVIFANIRKFIVYLLSCNLSEIMVVGLASLSGMPLPILPLQILYLNLVTDVFPAFALGAGEGEPDVMERPPRNPREPLLARRHWITIVSFGAAITASTLAAFYLSVTLLAMTPEQAVTIAFLTLALSQLWNVFNMREQGTGFLRNEITRNLYVWAAIAWCLALTVGAVYMPGLSDILSLSPPDAEGWMLAVGLSLVPWLLGQLAKLGPRKKHATGTGDGD